MKVKLAYGRGFLPVELPDDRTTVIEPADAPGLPDERAAVLDALENPTGAPPLTQWIRPKDRVCVVFTDVTRATPNDRLIPWLLHHLRGVPRDRVTLVNAVGTHRPNTPAELERLLTPEVTSNYRVVNHACDRPEDLVPFGVTRDGSPALINRLVAEADVRIVTGFIEPHFFAGFSGGPKGIMPGVAGAATVMSNHGHRNIAHPNARFGVLDGNPIWEEMRDIALRIGPSFLLNVALNPRRQITGVFAGHLLEAHRKGADFVRRSAMQTVSSPFDVVVTTNSGYPLDQNLYQAVKGISAGARILRPDGALILAAECREGVPSQSAYDRLLRRASCPEALLHLLATPGFSSPEQWQVQIQALIQRLAKVHVFSSLPDESVKAAHFVPCHDIGALVQSQLETMGPQARVAVLPQGPLTIPYLA
jgi:lactate racemase